MVAVNLGHTQKINFAVKKPMMFGTSTSRQMLLRDHEGGYGKTVCVSVKISGVQEMGKPCCQGAGANVHD